LRGYLRADGPVRGPEFGACETRNERMH
jgi:hypothetical protein